MSGSPQVRRADKLMTEERARETRKPEKS